MADLIQSDFLDLLEPVAGTLEVNVFEESPGKFCATIAKTARVDENGKQEGTQKARK